MSLFVVSSAWAGTQVVHVSKSFKNKEVFEQNFPELREKALVQGAIQEINKILPSSLSGKREEVFKEYLKDKIDNYVLSYSQERKVKIQNKYSLIMNLSLNVRALKDLLKNWGTYYTSQGRWGYSLKGELNKQNREKLAKYRAMSGLTRKSSGLPVLEIQRTENNNWSGNLEGEEKSWSVKDSSLAGLWKGLWSNYFSDPKIQDRVEKEVFVNMGVWASISGVRDFDKKLQGREYLLDKAVLKHIWFKAQGISACWRIVTIDPRPLKEYFSDFAGSRRLDYTFFTSEQGLDNSTF